MHIIMVGKPGVGKCSLLNTLAGSVLFRTDLNLIEEPNTHLYTCTSNDIKYSYTPALSSIPSCKSAALGISRALCRGGAFKLIFVTTLENNLVRSGDITTLQTVLQGIKPVLADHALSVNVSIIVNKCTPLSLYYFMDKCKRENILANFAKLIPSQEIHHITFLPSLKNSSAQYNILVPCSKELREFITKAPQIYFPISPNDQNNSNEKPEKKESIQKESLQKEQDDAADKLKNAHLDPQEQPGLVYRILGKWSYTSSISTSNTAPVHIIMAGNPGAGKSFLLNSLSGSILFPSGISLVDGKTKNFCTRTRNGCKFSDTPGLDDYNSRQRAAGEISKALRQGGTFKLIFVTTLEEGRVRPADVTTINLVLRAIESVAANHDVTGRFSVLVNKCSPRIMKMMEKKNNIERVRGVYSKSKRVEHLGFLPRREDAFDGDNVLVTCPEDLQQFIEKAPDINIPVKSDVKVCTDDFQNECESIQKMIVQVEEQLKELENEPGLTQQVLRQLIPSFIFGAGGTLLRGLGAAPVASSLIGRAVASAAQAFSKT